MIGPEVFATVNHILDNDTELCFSKYFRLNQVANIEFNKLMDLVLVSKNVHDVGFLIICDVATATSNGNNGWFYL